MKRYTTIIIAAAAALVAACSNQPVAEDRQPDDAGGQIEQVVEQTDCETFGEFARLETIMANERSSHSALLLEDGRVLVVGGRGKGGARWPRLFPHSEIYDPATGRWSPSGDMGQEREFFTLISLGEGSILSAGGTDVQLEPPKTTEVRDPGTGEWSASGKMSTGRERGAAVLLSDGRVLYTGGKNKNLREQDSTEIFDPANGEWTEAAPMGQARSIHTATLLLDGRVLVVGGKGEPVPDVDSQLRQTAEIYDPETGEWSPAGEMAEGRAEHTATVLSDGRVLVIGSLGNKATAEIYDPDTDTWYDAGSMEETRYRHTATVLSDGGVLVVGGQSTESVTINAEVFTHGAFASGNACATGVRGSESTLVGIEPAEPVAEEQATPTPVGGSRTSGRDASQFAFSGEVIDAVDGEEVTVAPLGTIVRLDVGERMASPSKGNGLTVTFLEVVEDSRCPADVGCPSAGQATIKVHIAWFGQDVGELSLTLAGDQVDPTIGTPGGAYFVALASLEPLPDPENAGSLDLGYKADIAVFQK